jgi:hypothetical protein
MNGFHQAVEYESRPTVAFLISGSFTDQESMVSLPAA